MSSIAAELGGSKGTLWGYFPSKEALFEAVLDGMIGRFAQAMGEALIFGGGTAATLRRFAIVYMEKITSPPALALHRLIVAEVDRFPQLGRIFYERGPKRTRARLAEYMEGEMTEGRLRRADPAIAAAQFLSLCLSRCYYERLWGLENLSDRPSVTPEIEAAVDCFMRAYGPEGCKEG
ncbi:TetR/AcrR family transcriptional regulator [Sphingomonas oleivorans]